MQYFKKIIISVCLLFVINSNAVITYALPVNNSEILMVTDYVFKANDLINKMNLEINYQKGLYDTTYDKKNYDTFINGLNDIKKKADNDFLLFKNTTKDNSNVLAGVNCFVFNTLSPKEIYNSIENTYNEFVTYENNNKSFYGYYYVSNERQNIVNLAMSCQGKIKYDWANKPKSKGYQSEWAEGKTGLDCSGFIQWVYWTTLNTEIPDKSLYSTYDITHNNKLIPISYEDLKPGDIGLIINDGTYYTDILGNKYYDKTSADNFNKDYATINNVPYVSSKTHTNHVGIYIGKDDNGNDLWCHEKGHPESNVVVNNYDKFTIYYRVIN